MKKVRLILTILWMLPLALIAQTQEVVHWYFTANPLENGHWKVQARATMDKGFHIWALDPGGDGTLIATSITIDKMDGITMVKDWSPLQEPVSHDYEFIEGTVHYFEREVVFECILSSTSKKELTGTVAFQTCNDKMCFPPKDETFTIKLQ
jgi:hypothetical protein